MTNRTASARLNSSTYSSTAVAPYGANDAGGFRNVLPPGEAGVANALQLGQFEAAGTRPAHWDDQLPLYTGLLYASPTLTHDDGSLVETLMKRSPKLGV